MSDEGNFLVFGEAEHKSHPLIVVVGREPNNDMGRSVAIESYAKEALNGGKWPGRVQFWNNTYGLIGRFIGMSPAKLKCVCITQKSSPIAFTDASPVSLDGRYSAAEKRKICSQLTNADFQRHIEEVFSHTDMFERTELVIVAGVKDTRLDRAVVFIETACAELGIPCCHIHSLSSRMHTQASRKKQLAEHAGIIESVMAEFLPPPASPEVTKAA